MTGTTAGAAHDHMRFGLVLFALEQYGNLVHALAASPYVAQADFTYQAPIYKGSDAIKQGLAEASSALDKFDVYFKGAILDENERQRFANIFRTSYSRKHPRSERSDLFLASGDVFTFGVELVQPASLDQSAAIVEAVRSTPHDPAALLALEKREAIDRAHLRATFRLFLDDVHNTRWHRLPAVQAAMRALGTSDPYVVEAGFNGALPGYLYWALAPYVHHVGGKMLPV